MAACEYEEEDEYYDDDDYYKPSKRKRKIYGRKRKAPTCSGSTHWLKRIRTGELMDEELRKEPMDNMNAAHFANAEFTIGGSKESDYYKKLIPKQILDNYKPRGGMKVLNKDNATIKGHFDKISEKTKGVKRMITFANDTTSAKSINRFLADLPRGLTTLLRDVYRTSKGETIELPLKVLERKSKFACKNKRIGTRAYPRLYVNTSEKHPETGRLRDVNWHIKNGKTPQVIAVAKFAKAFNALGRATRNIRKTAKINKDMVRNPKNIQLEGDKMFKRIFQKHLYKITQATGKSLQELGDTDISNYIKNTQARYRDIATKHEKTNSGLFKAWNNRANNFGTWWNDRSTEDNDGKMIPMSKMGLLSINGLNCKGALGSSNKKCAKCRKTMTSTAYNSDGTITETLVCASGTCSLASTTASETSSTSDTSSIGLLRGKPEYGLFVGGGGYFKDEAIAKFIFEKYTETIFKFLPSFAKESTLKKNIITNTLGRQILFISKEDNRFNLAHSIMLLLSATNNSFRNNMRKVFDINEDITKNAGILSTVKKAVVNSIKEWVNTEMDIDVKNIRNRQELMTAIVKGEWKSDYKPTETEMNLLQSRASLLEELTELYNLAAEQSVNENVAREEKNTRQIKPVTENITRVAEGSYGLLKSLLTVSLPAAKLTYQGLKSAGESVYGLFKSKKVNLQNKDGVNKTVDVTVESKLEPKEETDRNADVQQAAIELIDAVKGSKPLAEDMQAKLFKYSKQALISAIITGAGWGMNQLINSGGGGAG